MSLAEKRIRLSRPYLRLLCQEDLPIPLRQCLMRYAPVELFDVLTQTSRHLINASLCSRKPHLCKQFRKALYLFANPDSRLSEQRLVLLKEPVSFLQLLCEALFDKLASEDNSDNYPGEDHNE